MTLYLKRTIASKVPVEVEGVLPETLRDLTRAEIERHEIYHGNRKVALAEFFAVRGDAGDERLVWEGDLAGVHWIGTGMTRGEIRVEGAAGRHVGSRMRGGRIVVAGDAGDWLGGEMVGGQITVRGSAGHLVGSAYRGSARGMTGGTILVYGSAGNEIGHSMRRGLIAVGRNAADLTGFNLMAGTILVLGNAGIRYGAGMRRGTLALLGAQVPPPLVTFRPACRCRLNMLQLLAGTLRRAEFPVPDGMLEGPVELAHGDLLEGGRGELLTRAA